MESKLFKYVVPMCLTGLMSLASCSSDDSVGQRPTSSKPRGRPGAPGVLCGGGMTKEERGIKNTSASVEVFL